MAGNLKILKGFRTPAIHWREGPRGGRRPKGLEGGNRGRLPFTGVRGRAEAGVRKAWREETAGACHSLAWGAARRQASERPGRRKPRGSSHRRWCRSMGNLPALV